MAGIHGKFLHQSEAKCGLTQNWRTPVFVGEMYLQSPGNDSSGVRVAQIYRISLYYRAVQISSNVTTESRDILKDKTDASYFHV